MASNRHLGRIIALQTLFERDFRLNAGDANFDVEEVLARNIERYKTSLDDVTFIEQIVRGTCKMVDELDAMLEPIAPEWPIKEIARMDRVVLEMGLYELLNTKDVPPKVVINEAVELAKSFGNENSSKFVNGVLGTVLRQQTGEEVDPDPKAEESPADQTDTPEPKKPKKSAKKTEESA